MAGVKYLRIRVTRRQSRIFAGHCQSGASKKRVVSQKTRKTRYLATEGPFKMGLEKRRGAPIENLAARLCAHSEGMRI